MSLIKQNIVFLVFLLLLISACTNQPTSIEEGEDFYKDVPHTLVEKTLFPDMVLVVVQEMNHGDDPVMFLGEYDDQQYSLLLQFNELSDSSIVFLSDSVEIVSARILLSPISVYGDPAGEFTASLHEVYTMWYEEEIYDLDYSSPLTYGIISPAADTQDSIDVPIDLLRQWALDTLSTNPGVLIRFENASFAKLYHSKEDTVYSSSIMKVTFRDNSKDSTWTQTIDPIADTYFNEPKKSTESGLFVTNYGPHRLLLRFNTDSISSHSSITYAELVLKLDIQRSLFDSTSEYSFWAGQLFSDTWLPDDLMIFSDSESPVAEGLLDSDDKLHVKVTKHVWNWTSRLTDSDGMIKYPNNGLLLEIDTDLSIPFKCVFYGDESSGSAAAGDSSTAVLRPYLFIKYTEFNLNK